MLNNNKDLEVLTHKLYKTLTVLPLSSLLTETNRKTKVFNTTHNTIVDDDDGTTSVKTVSANIYSKRIKDICYPFSALLFTPIIVNQRADGTYYIVDGWHRLLAAESMGWTTIPCFVLHIKCGEEYVTWDNNNNNNWYCNGGFLDESDITDLLECTDLDYLLNVLE